jgi:uridylate kinase
MNGERASEEPGREQANDIRKGQNAGLAGPGARWRRILLKVSGELLAGGDQNGIDAVTLAQTACEVHEAAASGVQVALVIGGGNLFRGVAGAARGMDRAQSDSMGMLATVINALAFQDALEQRGCLVRVMSAVSMDGIAEPFIRRRAIRHLEKGRVVICAGGTGHPYFSTDTAAALRALEVQADVLLKGTRVDGIYDRDPLRFPDAVFLPELDHQEALRRGIRVMDATAMALCMENSLPIVVFNLKVPGTLGRVLAGERLGTRIHCA